MIFRAIKSYWPVFALMVASATGGSLINDWLASDAGCTTLFLERRAE